MTPPEFEKTFEGWREIARRYLAAAVKPDAIPWDDATPSLFSSDVTFDAAATAASAARPSAKITVPAEFLDLAQSVAYARDADRWSLLYRILYRLRHENPNLMKIAVDRDVLRAQTLKKSVRRDIHKMHAFVRFKRSQLDGEEIYVAWHKPEHLTVRPGTPFFARRFGDRRWSVFTPDESAHWDLEKITFGPGIEQHQFQTQDAWDDVWKTYYRSIFNPARIKIKMMKSEMSPKYWASLPEAALIHELVREAPKRLQAMAALKNEAAIVSSDLSLAELRESAKSCRACPLFGHATQTVFGVGFENADLMIVGEQPGEQEDHAGQPFVGPAGEVLEKALAEVFRRTNLDPDRVYKTNAVKHFKWKPQNGVRLHQKPSGREMHACKPWLEAEIARVRPKVIIALGTTAATAVMGRLPKISTERGRVFTDVGAAPAVIVSWHPAAILRASDPEEARVRRDQLYADLLLAARSIRGFESRSVETTARLD